MWWYRYCMISSIYGSQLYTTEHHDQRTLLLFGMYSEYSHYMQLIIYNYYTSAGADTGLIIMIPPRKCVPITSVNQWSVSTNTAISWSLSIFDIFNGDLIITAEGSDTDQLDFKDPYCRIWMIVFVFVHVFHCILFVHVFHFIYNCLLGSLHALMRGFVVFWR